MRLKITIVILCFLLVAFTSIIMVNADGSDINLTIASPTHQNYSDRGVLLNITTDKLVDDLVFIDYADKTPRWKPLCTDCDSYSKVWSFLDGEHNLQFKALFDGEPDIKDIDFFVDSKAPAIHSIKPSLNISINNMTNFTMKYSEDFIKNVRFKYGIFGTETSENVSGCFSGRMKNCSYIAKNLSKYDDQQIVYYFEIEDIIGRNATSKIQIITVDTTLPKINNFKWNVIKNTLNLSMDVVEKNFYKVVYYDRADPKSRGPVALCTYLKYGTCNAKKVFRKGTHNLDIVALDKAGNSQTEHIDFTIK